jgi:hypothetical protein
MTHSGKMILSSAKALRHHLTSPIFAKHARAGCLVVSSTINGDDSKGALPKVQSFVDQSNFTISMELGLKSVHSTVSSAFPTITVRTFG